MYNSKLLFYVSFALCLAGCGGQERPGPPAQEGTRLPSRIYLIGVDGLTWNRVDPLLEAGELPHLGGLIDSGVRATARGSDPLTGSSLWTTALTGKLPAKHRILSHMITLPNGPRAMAPSSARPTKNLWQILSDGNHLVASVDFPGTWPAEVINGFLVSPYYSKSRWTETEEHTFDPIYGFRDTFPSTLYDEIQPLTLGMADFRREWAGRFFTLRENEYQLLYDEPLGSVAKLGNPLKDFALTMVHDLSNVEIARYIDREYSPRVIGVHLELLDTLQPVYWPFTYAAIFSPPGEHHRRFKRSVDEGYRWIDEQIGRLLEGADDGAAVIVVGSYGFKTGESIATDTRAALPVPQRSEETVFIAAGPGLKSGHDLGTVNLTDVTPTVLRMVNQPIADDFDGVPLKAAFTDDFSKAFPAAARESYDTGWDPTQRFPQVTPPPVQEDR